MNGTNLPRKLRIPSHVMAFHCTQCGECCTNKWIIETDAVSYDKLYQKFQQLHRHKEFYDNIVHHKVLPQIRFLSNGQCPYLTNNNFCSIQLELGEEYLLDICKTFPRRLFIADNILDFSLSLTCKAAVNTLQHEAIYIAEMVWPLRDDPKVSFSFMQPNTITQYYPDKCLLGHSQLPYYALEETFIQILQNKNYAIKYRILMVGQLIKWLLSENQLQSTEALTLQVKKILSDTHFYNPEPDVKRHIGHLFFLSNIFLQRFTSLPMSTLLKNILLALASNQPKPTDKMLRSKVPPPNPVDYQQKLKQYYQPACSIMEPILENYMVNYILNKSFYLKPLPLAYYRMSFTYAATIAFSVGYSILANQPINQSILLQAIYDVESIFYSLCFDARATNYQAGQGCLQMIENAIALANV